VAAAQTDGAAATLLRALDAASRAADPEAAIGSALHDLGPADVRALLAQLDTLTPALTGAATLGLAELESALDEAVAQQRELRDVLGGLQPAIADPTLAAAFERALGLLSSTGPLAGLAQALGSIRELGATVARLTADLQRDPRFVRRDELARTVARLRAARDSVAGIASELEDAADVLATMRAWAETRADAESLARLAAAEAALREHRAPDDPAIDACWRDAFAAAVRGGLLPLARETGRRVQHRGMLRGTLEPFAAVAEALADLAALQGDLTIEVGARAEVALAAAQMPARRDEAHALAELARDRAATSDDPTVRARGRLAYGQVLEKLGDAAGARIAFRKLLDDAAKDPGFPYEAGWSALHLGRLEHAAGQHSRARRDLLFARNVGHAAKDWLLYGLAARAGFELAVEEGRRDDADAILAGLATDGVALGGPAAAELREELAERGRATFGRG
jgi:tetratricopeptide (TPR) repeat protein